MDSSTTVIVSVMVEEKGTQAEERQDEPRLWRPWRPPRRRTAWRVLWAVGMVVAVLTTALLILDLRPEIWKGLLEGRGLTLVALGFSLTSIIVLLAIGGAASSWTGFRGKTVWDLLQLLIVPLALAVIGLWFAAQQDARQQQIENERAEAERELAVQRAQDESLQSYLDQMGSLLLERDLRTSKEDSEVRTLARARTLTVLGRLDPSRKTAVMEFLAEAKLLQNVEGRGAIIKFSGADLSGANLTDAADNLSGADLSSADLSGANLSCNRSVIFFGFGVSQRCSDLRDADLSFAVLRDADLYSADLVGANLLAADLSGADLSFAVLRDADLKFADLSAADLRDANLSGAALSFADLSDANLRNAYLSNAVLSRADLRNADLNAADLSDANLIGAALRDADLFSADLRNANLSQATGVTNKQLSAASSLEGATMPDGQKYEDWLKDKESNGEDE